MYLRNKRGSCLRCLQAPPTDSNCDCGGQLCGASTHILQTSLVSSMSHILHFLPWSFSSAADVAGSHVAHIRRQPRSIGVVIYSLGDAHCGMGVDKQMIYFFTLEGSILKGILCAKVQDGLSPSCPQQ